MYATLREELLTAALYIMPQMWHSLGFSRLALGFVRCFVAGAYLHIFCGSIVEIVISLFYFYFIVSFGFCLFLQLLGFSDSGTFDALSCVLEGICESFHSPGLEGFIRDVAVAEVLVARILPRIHERICEAELPLLWVRNERNCYFQLCVFT